MSCLSPVPTEPNLAATLLRRQRRGARRSDGVTRQRGGPIDTAAKTTHGLWPSPDNSPMYVALQKSDHVIVVDTARSFFANTYDTVLLALAGSCH